MDKKIIDKHIKKWITVQAYKHDGLLHRQWSPAYLTIENDDYWAICSRASLVTESDGRRWMTKEHAVFLLFKHKWMNVICMMKEKGLCYYVNIASPTIFEDGYLKYIDYDLDVKLFPDGLIKELDEQEFERHVLTYGYSPELTNAIRKSMSEVKEAMKKKEFPFVNEEMNKIYEQFLEDNRPFIVTKKEDH